MASVETLLKDANLEFHFEGVQFAYALNPAKQGLLAMVLREAMNNIIKHADATTVHVALSETTDGLQLDIKIMVAAFETSPLFISKAYKPVSKY